MGSGANKYPIRGGRTRGRKRKRRVKREDRGKRKQDLEQRTLGGIGRREKINKREGEKKRKETEDEKRIKRKNREGKNKERM